MGLPCMSWGFIPLKRFSFTDILYITIYLCFTSAEVAWGDLWVMQVISSKNFVCDWILWSFVTSEAPEKSSLSHILGHFYRAHFPEIESPNFSIFCNLDRLRIFQIIKSYFLLSCWAVLPLILSFFSHFTLRREKTLNLPHLLRNLFRYILRKFCFPHVFRKEFPLCFLPLFNKDPLFPVSKTCSLFLSHPSLVRPLTNIFLLTSVWHDLRIL